MAEIIPLESLGRSTSRRASSGVFESVKPDRPDSQVVFGSSTPIDPETPTTTAAPSIAGSSAAFIPALPPVDGGRKAWAFLLGATVIEVLVWGLPFSVGILHVYWTNTLFHGQGESTITLAATLQTGLLYMSGMILGPVFEAFPRYTKVIMSGGLIAVSMAFIGSAFVTRPWHLIVTFGCLYPLGGALYFPCASILFEWFQVRRGLAAGIMFAGTGAGGTIFPFVMTGLLNRFGYKAAMISLGLGYLFVGGLAIIPIERRIPVPRFSSTEARPMRRRQIDWTFAKRKTMFFGMATILFTSMGNFIPSLWLPSFADELTMTSPSGVGLIAIMNAASVPGNTLLGWLSDRFPLPWVIALSCIGSALSCLFLWGFGTTSAPLIAFSLVFGLLGTSFSGVWSRMISIVAHDDPVAPALTLSIFSFVRGIGNISSGPISDSLLKVNALRGAAGAYGFNNYGILLIFTGLSILIGSATGLAFFEKHR